METEIIEQRVHFKGLLNTIDIQPEEYLLPLQEVVVNSIQSILDLKDSSGGQIIISILRKNELVLEFNEDTGEVYNPIIGFKISDNGVGFTTNRFEAFRTPYTDFGSEKHGCKGIGRYTVLACFQSMDIKSHYEDNDKMASRFLRFDNLNGLQKIPQDQEVSDIRRTIVTLNNFKVPYQKFINKNTIQKYDIAEGLIQHCMLYFLNSTAPTILLKEEKESLLDATVLNDIYRDVISIEKIEPDIIIDNIKEPFTLNYIKNYNGVHSHSLHLCANNRQVGKKQTLSKNLPSFKELYDDEKKKYHLSLYVTGQFLDDKAHPQRNKFSIPENEDKKNDFDEISLDKLYEGLADRVKSNYSDQINEAEKEKVNRIKDYILDKKNPRLKYKHLLNVENAFDKIPINASKSTLEAHLNELTFKLEQKREKIFEKIFSKKKYDKDEFGKIVSEVLKEEVSFSKDKLADLMVQRKSVLKLFRKYLEWRDDGNYMLEEDLHNIIFTMGGDTDSTPHEYHNLWLLDERLAFHTFTASDKQLRSNTKIDSKSQNEPDIFVYDIPYAFTDNPNKVNSLVLFEFKRPGRDMNSKDDKRLDGQLEKYFVDLLQSKAKNKDGRFINIEKETPKFGYIVCDLHKDLINYNIEWNNFKKTPNGTLYKVNPELNLYFEAIDYNNVVDFAEQRHSAFFKALGIDL